MSLKKLSAKKNKWRPFQAFNEDLINHYMREIGPIKILSRDEEYALSEQIKRGSSWALEELVRHNLKYVVTVANKYQGCGLSLQDLIEEGNIGLIQAAKRFDGTRRIKFITYATSWIRQTIKLSLAEAGTVKIPIKQASMLHKIGKHSEKLRQILKREPTTSEIAVDMDITESQFELIMRAYRNNLSLDAPISKGDNTPYLDFLETNMPLYEDQLIHESLKKKINSMINELTPREEEIIRMRFGFNGDPMTLNCIGKKTGLSRERVRQIEERAKKKLARKYGAVSLRRELYG